MRTILKFSVGILAFLMVIIMCIYFTSVRVGMDRMTALKRLNHPIVKRDTIVDRSRNVWGGYSPSEAWMYIFRGDTLAEIRRFKIEELNNKHNE